MVFLDLFFGSLYLHIYHIHINHIFLLFDSSLTLPSKDLKDCLISCLWALFLFVTISMMASSSVPVVKKQVITIKKGSSFVVVVNMLYLTKWDGIPNPFIAFLRACASAAGSKLDAGRMVGLS